LDLGGVSLNQHVPHPFEPAFLVLLRFRVVQPQGSDCSADGTARRRFGHLRLRRDHPLKVIGTVLIVVVVVRRGSPLSTNFCDLLPNPIEDLREVNI
jgi:hypothetical protein